MEIIQDVREAQARWERVFAGKREPVNLTTGRRGGSFAKWVKKATNSVGPAVHRRPAHGH